MSNMRMPLYPGLFEGSNEPRLMREVVDARNFIAGSVLAFLLFEFGRKVDVANSHLTLCLLLMATGIRP
jgi:stage III sporulation protein SpoIIIAA